MRSLSFAPKLVTHNIVDVEPAQQRMLILTYGNSWNGIREVKFEERFVSS
jgi:hypothetical protein